MAFRRLQVEIVRGNTDLTILAWDSPRNPDQLFSSLLATSPAAFEYSGEIIPFHDDLPSLSVTNKGLVISGDVPMRISRVREEGSNDGTLHHIFFLGTNKRRQNGGIYLRKVGPQLFYRDAKFPLAGFENTLVYQEHRYQVDAFHILIDPGAAVFPSSLAFRWGAFHVPRGHIFELDKAVPKNLWDVTDRLS